MKSTLLLAACVSLTLSSSAFAEPTTAPQNSAGYGATNLEGIRNPFGAGNLEIKSRQVEAQAGHLQNTNGQKGGTVSLDLDKKYLIDGHGYDNGYSGAMLHPSFHGRLDVLGKDGQSNQVKTELEIGGIAAYTAQLTSASPHAIVSEEELRKMTVSDTAEIRFKREDFCPAYDPLKFPSCYAGLPKDQRDWSKAQWHVFTSRKVPVYSIAIKPSTAGEVVFLEATGVYKRNPLIKSEIVAGKVQVLKLAGETSFRIGGHVQIDLCASGSAGILAGQMQVGEHRSSGAVDLRASACGGIQVGQLGRVGYEVAASAQQAFNDTTNLATSQSVSLSKIANSPLKLMWKRENETSLESVNTAGETRVGGVTTDLIMVGGAF